MYLLIEENDGKRSLVESDEDRATMEDFTNQYHTETPGHGPLFYCEVALIPINFRVSFSGGVAPPRHPDARQAPQPTTITARVTDALRSGNGMDMKQLIAATGLVPRKVSTSVYQLIKRGECGRDKSGVIRMLNQESA